MAREGEGYPCCQHDMMMMMMMIFVQMFQFSFNFDSSERSFFQQSSRVEFYLSIDFNFLNFYFPFNFN